MKIVVFDAPLLNPGDIAWTPLERLGEVRTFDTPARHDIPAGAADAEAAFVLRTVLNREAIRAMPALRFAGVIDLDGGPHVNVAAAQKRGVTVCRVPADIGTGLAEHAFALTFELARNVGQHAGDVACGGWLREGRSGYWVAPLRLLAGRTLALVGWEPAGPSLARRALAFGMRVIVHAPASAPAEPGVDAVSLDTAIRKGDIVAVLLPAGAAWDRLINAERLAAMKPDAWLVHIGGPRVVDDLALAAALAAGPPAAAALDGLALEPPPPDHPLLTCRNCLITPRHGWAARETRQQIIEAAASSLAAFVAGRPMHVLSPQPGDAH